LHAPSAIALSALSLHDALPILQLSPAEQKWGAAQITGGSHNTRVLWDPIRMVGARMRGQLVTAASQRLGVPVTALRTEDGHVVRSEQHPSELQSREKLVCRLLL